MAQKIEVDTRTFIRFWAVLCGFLLFFWFLSRALIGLMLVGAALFLAVALRPLVAKIGKVIKNRTTAVVIAVAVVVGVVVSAILLVGPVMISETSRFLGQLPEKMSQMQHEWGGIDMFGESIGVKDLSGRIAETAGKTAQGMLANLGNTAIASIGMIGQVITGGILVIVLTLLFLLQGPVIMEEIWKKTAKQDSGRSQLARRITERIAEVISKYVFGQVTVALVDGVVVAAVVFLLSLVFGFSAGLTLPMGVIAFVLYLIPMFGPLIAWVIISVLLAFSSLPAGISFAIFYILYAQIENNAIAPKIQGGAMKLPSLAILVAITVGMYMLGLVGAIVAIPIAGAIKVLVEEYPNIRDLQ